MATAGVTTTTTGNDTTSILEVGSVTVTGEYVCVAEWSVPPGVVESDGAMLSMFGKYLAYYK